LISGLENFQPNLNMFGSNVFSSLESGLKDSVDIQSVMRSIDGLVSFNARNSSDAGRIANKFTNAKQSNANSTSYFPVVAQVDNPPDTEVKDAEKQNARQYHNPFADNAATKEPDQVNILLGVEMKNAATIPGTAVDTVQQSTQSIPGQAFTKLGSGQKDGNTRSK